MIHVEDECLSFHYFLTYYCGTTLKKREMVPQDNNKLKMKGKWFLILKKMFANSLLWAFSLLLFVWAQRWRENLLIFFFKSRIDGITIILFSFSLMCAFSFFFMCAQRKRKLKDNCIWCHPSGGIIKRKEMWARGWPSGQGLGPSSAFHELCSHRLFSFNYWYRQMVSLIKNRKRNELIFPSEIRFFSFLIKRQMESQKRK